MRHANDTKPQNTTRNDIVTQAQTKTRSKMTTREQNAAHEQLPATPEPTAIAKQYGFAKLKNANVYTTNI